MSDELMHRLTFGAREVPFSEKFEDAFYSRQDGRAETAHVFLAGNGLPKRFFDSDRFVIAELGFGTGLSFLETLGQWRSVRQPGQQLKYVSFERFPISADDMARALAQWPEFETSAADLVKRWADVSPGDGSRRNWQMDGQTELCLLIGDANDAVAAWDGLADAWFLDGFAPARNPEMWGRDLMADVFGKTARGGSFATYTAAGWVRRNLTAAGFAVEKRPGFGGKREMMCGVKA